MDEGKESNLHKAYLAFAEAQTQSSYEEFLLTFFMNGKVGKSVHVPAETNQSGLMYGLVRTTDGYYYSICSSADELVKCPQETSVLVALDKLIVRAINDDQIKGICINPYSDCPCFVPAEYLQKVVG